MGPLAASNIEKQLGVALALVGVTRRTLQGWGRGEYSQGLVYFWGRAIPCDMQDLSSPPRDRTRTPCTGSVES